MATVNTIAQGINDKSEIVGYYQDVVSSGGLVNHGFIYSKGIYTTLYDPFAISPSASTGTANGTAALGINNKGQVVGYYFDSNAHANGFLYSEGKYTTLDDPLGIDGTVATGINDKGQIVGYYQGDSSNPHGIHGFEANPEAVHNKDGSGMHGFLSLGEGQDNFNFQQHPTTGALAHLSNDFENKTELNNFLSANLNALQQLLQDVKSEHDRSTNEAHLSVA